MLRQHGGNTWTKNVDILEYSRSPHKSKMDRSNFVQEPNFMDKKIDDGQNSDFSFSKEASTQYDDLGITVPILLS